MVSVSGKGLALLPRDGRGNYNTAESAYEHDELIEALETGSPERALEALLDEAEQAIQEGRSRDEVLETDAIPGFPDHRALGGRLTAGAALAVACDELSERE